MRYFAHSLYYVQSIFVPFFISPSTNTPLLFLLCLDRLCESHAIQHASTDSVQSKSLRTIPYVLPATFIGENYFFTNILSHLIDFKDKDRWIGAVSGYVDSSHNVSRLESFFADTNTVNDTVDLIIFHNAGSIVYNNLTFLNQSCCHGVQDLLFDILKNIGESQEDIARFQSTSPYMILMESGFMTRSKWIEGFTIWLSHAQIFLNTDPLAQQRVWKSCTTHDSSAFLIPDVNDAPFISLHPLLGKLLTTYFFHTRNLKATTIAIGNSSSPMPISQKEQ